MSNRKSALRRNVTIINELGLHARSAAKIAKLAQPATGSVWIAKGDQKADAGCRGGIADGCRVAGLDCTEPAG